MNTVYRLMTLLLFYCTTQAQPIPYKQTIDEILNAPSKQAAYQAYTKAFRKFREEIPKESSRAYLEWLARLYKKSCQQLDEKAHDQSLSIMAKGLQKMCDQSPKSYKDDSSVPVMALGLRRMFDERSSQTTGTKPTRTVDSEDQMLEKALQEVFGSKK